MRNVEAGTDRNSSPAFGCERKSGPAATDRGAPDDLAKRRGGQQSLIDRDVIPADSAVGNTEPGRELRARVVKLPRELVVADVARRSASAREPGQQAESK